MADKDRLDHAAKPGAKAKKEQAEREERIAARRAQAAARNEEFVKGAHGRAEAETYVVQSGDSLSKIAKEVYGDASRWPEIFEANKDQISDPNLIRVGQELVIP